MNENHTQLIVYDLIHSIAHVTSVDSCYNWIHRSISVLKGIEMFIVKALPSFKWNYIYCDDF